MSSVLLVANDHVGANMAGPGIRYLAFARELSRRGHEVTLVVPFETDLVAQGFTLRVDNPWHARRMTPLCRAHDAVVTQRLPVPTMLSLAGSSTRAIYDLYSPPLIEHSAAARHAEAPLREDVELQQLTLRTALETGSAFVCASERQRDLWLGALVAAGRVDPDAYRADPTFRTLIDVVPFGIDPAPPASDRAVLKGVVPGIEPDDRVALWGGGLWDWLDPLTVIRAVARLDRPDLKLFFLGTERPVPLPMPDMAMSARAAALAEELGLLDRAVFFNTGWVQYADRGAYLLEADVGVSAHFDELEARFAFRTRLLDCIWAGLPVVTTAGDSLADAVREHDLGRTVAHEDVDAYAKSLEAVLSADRASFAERFAALRDELAWPRVVEPLAAMLAARNEGASGRRRPHLGPRLEYAGVRARLAVRTRGIAGSARRLLRGE
jgi:glycosyltransferase involved in cell wall biosynthesis